MKFLFWPKCNRFLNKTLILGVDFAPNQLVSTQTTAFMGSSTTTTDLIAAYGSMATAAAALYADGFREIRFDFRQSDLGGGNYTTMDGYVSACISAGLSIQGILNPNTDLSDSTERSGFVTYCSNVVTHYADDVSRWEISNEPNLNGSTKILMADYATALPAVYSAIHTANPPATVIAGVLASVETTAGGFQSAEEFIQYLYDNCPTAFDELSLHCYTDSGTTGWLTSQGASWHTRTIALGIIDIMETEGDDTRLLSITETGMPTTGADSLTEGNQARWLTDAYPELHAHPRIRSINWYSQVNRSAESTAQDVYGLRKFNLAPKLVLHKAVAFNTLELDTTPTFEHTKGGGNTTHVLFRRFVSTNDPLRSNLTYSLVGAPTGVAINSSTGVITVTDATVSPQLLTAITVRATHTNGTTADFAITLTVWHPNLITNPTFAGNVTSWASTGTATVGYDTDQENCLVTVNGTGGGLQDSQTITCTNGVSHTYRAKIKAGTFAGSLNMGYEASDVVIGPLTNNYVWYSRTVTTSDTDAALNIRRSTATTGTYHVDEVYFGIAL